METSELNNNNNPNSSLQKQKWCVHEFLYKFHNFWFIQPYLIATQKVLQDFKPLPTDIILASFPKTGTTWLKALLHSIIHRSPKAENPLIYNHPQELIPSLETNLYLHESNQEFDHTVNSPRILATHLPYQIIGDILSSSECKIVYVTRNPKDTLISLWHFVQKAKVSEEDPWDLEAAVDQFCKGIVPFGSYYDHVLAYREESMKSPQKVLFVTYEELKENPKSHVKKIAEFLGCPFEDEEEVEEVVKSCSFEVLSNQEVNKSSEMPNGFPLPYSSFFRKGEAGDYVNYLQEEMIERIDIVTRENFHDNGFVYGI